MEVVILDFETTGLSADYDRVIEVGAAVVKDGHVTETFSSFVNPGRRIPYEITSITGITNEMVGHAPNSSVIMKQLYDFIAGRPVVAHNASFDSRFLYAEMQRAKLTLPASCLILCTLLLSRRLIQDLPSYQLGHLARHLKMPEFRSHRALDDVLATARLWTYLLERLTSQSSSVLKALKCNLDPQGLIKISSTPKAKVKPFLYCQ